MSLLNFDLTNFIKSKMIKNEYYWTLTSTLTNKERTDYSLPYIIVRNKSILNILYNNREELLRKITPTIISNLNVIS